MFESLRGLREDVREEREESCHVFAGVLGRGSCQVFSRRDAGADVEEAGGLSCGARAVSLARSARIERMSSSLLGIM